MYVMYYLNASIDELSEQFHTLIEWKFVSPILQLCMIYNQVGLNQ